MKLKIANILYIPSLALLLLSSCAKDEKGTDLEEVSKDALRISVAVKDVEEIDPVNNKLAATNKNKDAKPEILNFNEFDAIQSVGPTADELKQKLQANTGKSNLLAATPVNSGVKYMLYLFKKTDAQGGKQYWAHKEMTVRTANELPSSENISIDVVRGDSYYWYAYTINSTATPPTATHTTNSLIINDIGNNGLFFDSGEITVSAQGVTPLEISFTQKMARVSLEFDARGMFTDEIQKLTVNVNNGSVPLKTKKGKFNLVTGLFEDIVETDLPQLAYVAGTNEVFQSFDPNPANTGTFYNDRKVAYIYTIPDPAGIATVNVNLSELTIKIDDGTPRAFTGLTSTFPFTNVALQAGRNYRLKIDLIESPLVLTGVDSKTVRWARQNIYVNELNTRNPYRFFHTYAHQPEVDKRSMFAFLADEPATYKGGTGLATNGGDPCLKVYPLGVWRSARRADWESLGEAERRTNLALQSYQFYTANSPVAQPVARGAASGTPNKLYWEFNTSSPTPQSGTYPSNKLRFNANGYIAEVGLVADILTLNVTNAAYGNTARYWAQENLVDLLGGIVTLGESYAIFQTESHSSGVYNDIDSYFNVNLGLLGISVLRSNFYNVRCVRN